MGIPRESSGCLRNVDNYKELSHPGWNMRVVKCSVEVSVSPCFTTELYTEGGVQDNQDTFSLDV